MMNRARAANLPPLNFSAHQADGANAADTSARSHRESVIGSITHRLHAASIALTSRDPVAQLRDENFRARFNELLKNDENFQQAWAENGGAPVESLQLNKKGMDQLNAFIMRLPPTDRTQTIPKLTALLTPDVSAHFNFSDPTRPQKEELAAGVKSFRKEWKSSKQETFNNAMKEIQNYHCHDLARMIERIGDYLAEASVSSIINSEGVHDLTSKALPTLALQNFLLDLQQKQVKIPTE